MKALSLCSYYLAGFALASVGMGCLKGLMAIGFATALVGQAPSPVPGLGHSATITIAGERP